MIRDSLANLTPREKEILMMVLEDASSAHIAAALQISLRTVDTHRKNIVRKTGARTMVNLVKWAIRNGLLKGYYYSEQ